MNEYAIWETVGYIGSALVLVSLLMSSIMKLRIINAVGSFIFCIYAFKIHSIPTAVMNICLVGINIFFMYRLLASKTVFSCVDAGREDACVKYILEHYRDDIAKYFDSPDISSADRVMLVFDGSTAAGLLAGVTEGDSLRIIIDYTTPAYRDLKVARFLYGVLSRDYRRIVYTGSNPGHVPYCLKMGYVESDGRYTLSL